MKRLLSLLVVIAMMISLIPNVFAAKEEIDMDELLGRLVVLEDISLIEVKLDEGSDGKIYQWTPAADEEATELNLSWYPETAVLNVTATTGETTVSATTAPVVDGEGYFGELTLPIVAGQLVEIEVSEANGAAAEAYIYGSLSGYPAGHETNPIPVNGPVEEVTIEKASWFQLYYTGDVVISGEGAFNVIYEAESIAAVDGKVTIAATSSRWSAPTTFQIDAAGTYTVTFIVPVGVMDNPAQLVIGENVVDIKAGSQGYFFTWTATEEGTLKITMPEGGWMYQIMNLTTYVQEELQKSDSDPVVNPAEIAVAAGDEIQLMVNTYDPAAPWDAPAGQLTIKAELVLPEPPAPALTITQQPKDIIAANNESVTLSVVAEGEGLKYQWYRSDKDTNYQMKAFTSAASKQADFAFVAYTGNHKRTYQCLITDAEGNQVWTDVVTLYITHFSTNAKSQYVANVGDVATFSVEYGVPGTTYQWQMKYSTEADSRWRNTSASGNNTNTLKFTANQNTITTLYQFRCIATYIDGNGNKKTETSNMAQLWYNAAPATIKSCTSGTLDLVQGYYAFLTVEAEGVGMQYYWQASTDGGTTWYNCSSSTSARETTFRVLAYPFRDGYQYRCMITTPNGASVKQAFSDVVTFNILPAATVTGQPQSKAVAMGESAQFTVTAQPTDGLVMSGAQQKGDNTTLTYQWQKSVNGGKTWVGLNSFEGCKTETLTVPATGDNVGAWFRCVVYNDAGYGNDYVFSAAAQLTVTE